MDNLVISQDRKIIEIKNNNESITFSQFDNSKLMSKYTEIDINKINIRKIIDTLKEMIK